MDPSPGGGLDSGAGCVVVFLVIVGIIASLVWGVSAVGDWASVKIEEAKASAEARKAEQAWARAEAEKAREEERTKRAEIALEKEKRRGINNWISSVAFRMDIASLLPFAPVGFIVLAIIPLAAGYLLGRNKVT